MTDSMGKGQAARGSLAVFSQYRALLFSIAYRMLGSVADAEDVLQETFIRWQQGGKEEICSPRSYLVTVISRLCINHLQSARKKREEYPGEWLPEPIVTDPRGDPLHVLATEESISMGFLLVLERLTPLERAVFLLREVFEYDYTEIAAMLNQTVVNCRQILRRSKLRIHSGRPRFQCSSAKQEHLLREFVKAATAGDMEGLLAILAQDVILHSDGGGRAIAVPHALHGADNVSRAILGSMQRLVPKGLERRLASINGIPGIVAYLDGKPFSILTMDVDDDRVKGIYILTNPEKLAHLPALAGAQTDQETL
jgi:RNA polymerase sigma-70 factor (ECF subfamily)